MPMDALHNLLTIFALPGTPAPWAPWKLRRWRDKEVNGCGAGIRASEKTLVQEGGAVDQHGKKDDVAMKAVICETRGRLAMIARPRPEPAPGKVLVHIRRIGVCGTDFHIFGGKHPFL